MTDFPWFFIHNDGPAGLPTDPSQRLRSASSLDSDGPLYHEPGNKLYFHTGEQYPGIWTYTHVPADATRWWEATVSSTRHGNTTGAYTKLEIPPVKFFDRTCPGHNDPEGDGSCANYPRHAHEFGESCIRVMTEDEQDGLEICRQKNWNPGPAWDQETIELYVREYHGGAEVGPGQTLHAARRGLCRDADVTPDHHEDGISNLCIGSMLAVSVENHGGSSVVKLYSSSRTYPRNALPAGSIAAGQPMWELVATRTFNRPMTKQGFRGWKDQLLAGVRTASALLANGWANPASLRPITLVDLPEQHDYAGGAVVDLSY
jgi:hypothetical protein